MKKIPEVLVREMRKDMEKKSISREERVDWFKWLRFYKATSRTYKGWVVQFQEFLKSKPVDQVNDEDAVRFLTWLATERKVVSTTQNQAFNALLFFP